MRAPGVAESPATSTASRWSVFGAVRAGGMVGPRPLRMNGSISLRRAAASGLGRSLILSIHRCGKGDRYRELWLDTLPISWPRTGLYRAGARPAETLLRPTRSRALFPPADALRLRRHPQPRHLPPAGSRCTFSPREICQCMVTSSWRLARSRADDRGQLLDGDRAQVVLPASSAAGRFSAFSISPRIAYCRRRIPPGGSAGHLAVIASWVAGYPCADMLGRRCSTVTVMFDRPSGRVTSCSLQHLA